jgi:hypothetical protein
MIWGGSSFAGSATASSAIASDLAWHEGRALSLDRAIEYALDEPDA